MKINELKEGKVYLNCYNNIKYSVVGGILMSSFDGECEPYEASDLSYNKVIASNFIEINSRLTEKEIAVLRLLPLKWKYIAKDADGKVYVYNVKSKKGDFGDYWGFNGSNAEYFNISQTFELDFAFLSWHDDEPILIADLISQEFAR